MAQAEVFDRTIVPVPSQRRFISLLHHYFEAQVASRPFKVAVSCDGEMLTYVELDALANRMAACLQRRGVGPGQLVALHLTKSVDLYAAVLAILKAGAGYVPLDPKFPRDRIADILDDSGAAAIITEADLVARFYGADAPILDVDLDRAEIDAAPYDLEPVSVDPSSIAYVIYTSGSTGRPKGVAIEHRNAIAFVKTIPAVYKVTADDRIYQGFSTAFDASVEELWCAFSTGATLIAPTEIVSRSPLDVAEFLTRNEVTFFSTVPTFLAMIDVPLPSVRTLVLGGEACAAELVTRWADGSRRMLNTYGPTEATVVATYAECQAGAPVTIGQALPGYTVHVLDETQTRVKTGAVGELYIGGPAVARGYLNRDELTAERFIPDPFSKTPGARLYRTFDQVRLTASGDLEFLGRLDSQVKIRGFRIELSEIEQAILEQPGIKASAVAVVGPAEAKDIAAFVVTDGVEIDRAELAQALRARLPEYMVPKFLDIVPALPMMTSGKVDRRTLPEPKTLLVGSARPIVPPANEIEATVASIWQATLKVSEVSVEDDFFKDLGGHSLLAAQTVTRMRAALQADGLSIRDLYKFPTVRQLADHLGAVTVRPASTDRPAGSHAAKTPSRQAFESVHWLERWTVVAVQALFAVLYNGLVAAPVALVALLVALTAQGYLGLDDAVMLGTAVGFAIWPTYLLLSVATKWLVIGRYKAGVYPVWGFYYLRWWIATRMQTLSWSHMFVGSPLMSLYWRAMGARVGRHVMIGTPIVAAFDLVSIGEGSSIGGEAHLLGYRVEDGLLKIGRIDVGRDCFVGEHATLGLDVTLEDGCRLDDLSAVADGTRLAAGRGYRGAPAAEAVVDLPPVAARQPGFWTGAAQLALIYVMGYFLIFSMLPGLAMIGAALYYAGSGVAIAAAFLSVPVSILWYALLVIVMKRLLIGRLGTGTFPVAGATYLRHWFLAYLIRNTRTILMPLYATIYFPTFLRLLGVKVGRNAEVSTVLQMSPDALEIGSGSFLADACIVGGPRVAGGTCEVKANRIGARSFIGNSAFVPGGVDIGQNCLIGVLSTPPASVEAVADDTRWLGAPGFALPRTQRADAFSGAETFEPSWSLKVQRGIVDALRILLPGLIQMGGVVLFIAMLAANLRLLGVWETVALVPVAATVAAFAALGVAALLKTLTIGRFQPIVRPLWCRWVWTNELVNGVYEGVAAPVITPFLGTPLAAVGLRMMGCKVGRWAFVETTLFSEFDLVSIGDHASLNLGATVQTHLFEDRIFKADHLRIGDGCTVGNMSVVLYDTTMEPGAVLGPLSLLMKGEHLPAGSTWHGIPCQAGGLRYMPRAEGQQSGLQLVAIPSPA